MNPRDSIVTIVELSLIGAAMELLSSVSLCVIFLSLVNCQLPATQDNPCKHPHGLVGDSTYCDRYWECVGGQAQLYDCPNGLVFVGRNRGIAEGCDYPWRGAYCQTIARGVFEEKKLANSPISTTNCDWLYGIFGHETSCTRYWTCWNGTSTEQFCIGGLLYNEETHACDWPQNVQGCQKHPLCKDDPNANVPLGQSCERYWACQGGYPRLQRCPATLVFDKISRRCVHPPTTDCEVLTTQAPIEEEGSPFRSGEGPPRQISQNANRRRNQPSLQQFSQQGRPNIIEEPVEEDFLPPQHEAPQAQSRPSQGSSKPRRPQISPANLPSISLPAGATPINFNNFPRPLHQGGNFRAVPIEGAIALN